MKLRRILSVISVALVATFVFPAIAQSQGLSERPKPFLLALDPQNGEQRWRAESGDAGVWRVLGERSGLVFVSQRPCLRAGWKAETILALERATGDERWRATVGAFGFTAAAGTFIGTTAVVVTRDGQLQGLNPKSGESRWKITLGDLVPVGGTRDLVLLAQPQSLPDLAAPEAAGELRAVDRDSGEVLWSYRSSPLVPTFVTVASRDTAVFELQGFGPQGPLAGRQVGIDLATGEQLWTVDRAQQFVTGDGWGLLFGPSGPGVGPPKAFDPRTLQERWVAPLADVFLDKVADGLVVTVAGSNRVVALDATDGQVVWEREETQFESMVASGHGLIVLAPPSGAEGDVAAVNTDRGTTRWTRPKPRGGGKTWSVGKSVYVAGGCTGVDET